jgi:hypothetical protein
VGCTRDVPPRLGSVAVLSSLVLGACRPAFPEVDHPPGPHHIHPCTDDSDPLSSFGLSLVTVRATDDGAVLRLTNRRNEALSLSSILTVVNKGDCGQQVYACYMDSVLWRPTLAAGESVELVADLHKSHASIPCTLLTLAVVVTAPDDKSVCGAVGVWTATSPPAREADSR